MIMFDRTLRFLALAAVALPLAACAPRDTETATTTTTTTTAPPGVTAPAPDSAATGAASPMAGMEGGSMSSPMAGMSGATSGSDHVTEHVADMPFDAMFLDMMIHHHEQAVQMAQEVLPQAKRPEVKQLAQAIIDSQREEIGKMQGWRKAWYPDTPPMSSEQMAAMMKMEMPMESPAAGAASEDPEQRFLTEMIPHHQDAVRMSQEAVGKAEHEELRSMARGIIAEQEKEIAQMREWLETWTAER